MQLQMGRRPAQTGKSEVASLKALREQHNILKRMLLDSLYAGCRKVPGEVSVQERSLTQDERDTVLELQRELRDVERQMRAFAS